MGSPAERQAEALADIERIASTMYDGMMRRHERESGQRVLNWREIQDDLREHWRSLVRDLLSSDLIRVGRRPEPPVQIPGQTSIDDPSEA